MDTVPSKKSPQSGAWKLYTEEEKFTKSDLGLASCTSFSERA